MLYSPEGSKDELFIWKMKTKAIHVLLTNDMQPHVYIDEVNLNLIQFK